MAALSQRVRPKLFAAQVEGHRLRKALLDSLAVQLPRLVPLVSRRSRILLLETAMADS